MFSHIFTGIKDFERAFRFYAPILQELGLSLKFKEEAAQWAGWQSPGGGRPLFVIGNPYNRQDHEAGNGQMVAFLAQDRSAVRRVHALALASGGQSEGEPGLREHYHANYYGAYFRDTEGNKVCVACHAPETGTP